MYYNKLILALLAVLLIQCSDKSQFSRSIELNGQSNFRDIGHYTNRDGQLVKNGMIYRSGALSELDSLDIEKLDQLEIKTVVSFLIPGEIKKYGEDRLPSDVNYFNFPIEGQNNEAEHVLQARIDGDFSRVPSTFNYNIHKLLIEDGKEAYKALFKLMADENNYPIVFHCSHGVHRTGTATALIQMMLDVPWEYISEDYILSNQCRSEENTARIQQLNELAQNNTNISDLDSNAQNISSFYNLEEAYIEGSAIAIKSNYGTVNNYLNQLGINRNDIKTIKSILLE